MVIRWLVAAVHLLGLGIGLGAVLARSRALREGPDDRAIRLALAADAWWGIAALVWIGTGVWRAFGGLEKGTTYYVTNHFFLGKMALLGLIIALEIWVAATLSRWRTRLRRGEAIDTAPAARIATVGIVQAVLVVLMVFLASGMARGFGH